MKQAHPLIPLLVIIVFETLVKEINKEKEKNALLRVGTILYF